MLVKGATAVFGYATIILDHGGVISQPLNLGHGWLVATHNLIMSNTIYMYNKFPADLSRLFKYRGLLSLLNSS